MHRRERDVTGDGDHGRSLEVSGFRRCAPYRCTTNHVAATRGVSTRSLGYAITHGVARHRASAQKRRETVQRAAPSLHPTMERRARAAARAQLPPPGPQPLAHTLTARARRAFNAAFEAPGTPRTPKRMRPSCTRKSAGNSGSPARSCRRFTAETKPRPIGGSRRERARRPVRLKPSADPSRAYRAWTVARSTPRSS